MVAAEKIKAGKLMYSFLNEFEVCEICKLRSEVFFFTGIHMAQAKLDTPVVRENSFLTPFSTLRDMKMLDHHGGDTVLKGGDKVHHARSINSITGVISACYSLVPLLYTRPEMLDCFWLLALT